MLQQGKHFFEFDSFRLDPAAGVLLRDGQLVPLTPKAIDTLAALVRQHGQVVSKEDLMKTVWPHSFVEEANLNVQISALRKVLNGTPGAPDFIETISRRGYRFCAEVHEVYEEPAEWVVQKRTLSRIVTEEEEITVTEADAQALPAPSARALPAQRTTSRWPLALSAMLVLSVALAAYFRFGPQRAAVSPAPARILLGVLPLANLSGNPEQEFLSDGMTEELITELGRLNPSQLGVIARASMMPYKGSNKGIRAIAQELGLKYLLEGSLIHSGGRLRINIKLIQASDQAQVWANEYDRDEKDLFQVQGEVARAVAREILGRVAPGMAARGTPPRSVKPEAYEAYLRGRFFWWKRNAAGNERARAYFQQAIQLDPTFARAYSGIADTYFGAAAGKEPALKAVELDPNSAEAQASLALVVWHELDWAGAEAHFRRALELDPYYISARHWYGFMLIHWGRRDESIEQLTRARESDPLNNVILTDRGMALYFSGRLVEARELLNKAVDLDPAFPWPHYWLGRTYEAEGRLQEALAEYQLSEDEPRSRMDRNTALACLYAKLGQPEKARQILRDMEKRTILPRNHALVLVNLGENQRAIEVLEAGYSKLHSRAYGLWMEPDFAPLRSDARFQRLISLVAPPTP